MSLADISIKRPTFITCVILLMLVVGYTSLQKLGVDLFPNVTFPVVMVTTPYPGAGPAEIETLVSKPLEDELSTLSGVKRLSSINEEGVSTVVAEFTLETDVKFAEQQIRDRVGGAKRRLPSDVMEPIVRRIDPADQPVLIVSLNADLPAGQLYDLANEEIRPRLEQVNQVGVVDVVGGRKREIQVLLNRDRLKAREVSASQVVSRLAVTGENIPAGKVEVGQKEVVFRSVGQFRSIRDVEDSVIGFVGSDVATKIRDLGTVKDTLRDERTRAFVNGRSALLLFVFKQSGANTIHVVENLKKRIDKMNVELTEVSGKPQISVIRDGSVWIRSNVDDVKESIMIGVLLAVVVVFLFLASGRSTIITGLALPNSLLGAFILMAIAGFTVNVMTLLALSLSVGLLVDDAIVVRENIFRHLEMGKSPKRAAREGTAEVRLAVIATTLAILAVFGPIAFLKGVVGQFFREFGLTICFAMAISLFDALTIAPMLSAYFAGKHVDLNSPEATRGIYGKTVGRVLRAFSRFQDRLEERYVEFVGFVLRRPILSLAVSGLVAVGSCGFVAKVPKTFLPAQDAGEFLVAFDLPPGTSLNQTAKLGDELDQLIRKNVEVETAALTIGGGFSGRDVSSNLGEFYVRLVPFRKRSVNTIEFKERLREQLLPYAHVNTKVKDYDAVGGGMRPFTVNFLGNDQLELEKAALDAVAWMKKYPGLKDVDLSFRPGKPEFQIKIDPARADGFGVAPTSVGQELRTQIEGFTPAKFREGGKEYDIRVRLQEDQRNLQDNFTRTYVPNINYQLVRLSDVASPVKTSGPTRISRQNRARYVQIGADIAPGAGLEQILKDLASAYNGEHKLPEGVRFEFVGQAENFQELIESMVMAITFGILFIFLVLASLYESFVTPFTIMLALPMAVSGSMAALFFANKTLDLFSMIGVVMLLGVAAKNSILLVDYANQARIRGASRKDAMLQAAKTRLRPILMTTMALIAGTVPIAVGLNEASRQRTSMGVAIIGGLISSTLLTLIVVPAVYSFIDRFREWSNERSRALAGVNASELDEVQINS